MTKKWMVAGVALLAVGAAAPWAVGYMTEQQWQGVTQGFNDSQDVFRVDTSEYQRGYMNAHVVGVVTIVNPDSGESHSFDYEAQVSHGVTGSLMDFSKALESGEEDIEYLDDERPRVTLETRVWGSATAEMMIPPVEVTKPDEDGVFQTSRFEAKADIAAAGSEADIYVSWPGMTLTSPDLNLSITDITLDQTMEHLAGEVWLGDGVMEMASLEFSAPGQPSFAMTGLSIKSTSDASDDGARFNSDTALRLENIRVDENSFGPHEIQVSMKDFDVAGINELYAALSDMQDMAMAGSPDADPQQMMQQQMEAFQRINEAVVNLATEGFSFGFPTIDLATPQGPITGKLNLSHPTLSGDEKAQTMMVMQGLSGSLDLSMPVALVENTPQLQMQVAPLVKQGMVTQEGDQYRLEGTLEDMALTINGNVVPLPPVF